MGVAHFGSVTGFPCASFVVQLACGLWEAGGFCAQTIELTVSAPIARPNRTVVLFPLIPLLDDIPRLAINSLAQKCSPP